MTECIHGFEGESCALCFPSKSPERSVANGQTGRVRPTRKHSADGTAVRSDASKTRGPGESQVPSQRRLTTAKRQLAELRDPAKTRIYHITHIDNLEGILVAGALLAETAGADPKFDIMHSKARAHRRALKAADRAIAEYVPFAFSLDIGFWFAIRSGRADPWLANSAWEVSASEYLIFVSSVGGIRENNSDVAMIPTTGGFNDIFGGGNYDGGAAAIAGWPAVEHWLARSSVEAESLAEAELLLAGSVRLDEFSLLAVSNDPVRDRVRAALKSAGVTAKVAVHPPWFLPGA